MPLDKLSEETKKFTPPYRYTQFLAQSLDHPSTETPNTQGAIWDATPLPAFSKVITGKTHPHLKYEGADQYGSALKQQGDDSTLEKVFDPFKRVPTANHGMLAVQNTARARPAAPLMSPFFCLQQ